MSGNVLIFGGTRGTGFQVARLLREQGDATTVLVREGSDASALEAIGATIVRGNALDPAAVEAAFASGQFRAAVNTLGGKRGELPRPDIEGIRQIVAGAKKAGVSRVLMVTAIGAGDSQSAVAPKVLEVLGEVLDMKTQAENILQDSGLDYTILRPGGMTDDPASGTAIKTEDHNRMGVINRADLAALLVECIDDDTTGGKIYHTIDPEITREAPLQRGQDLPKGPRR
ncbi:MAG: SDR family NAD(P)-dependent oxidoreductase [Gammaproteobacteria bacterium]|nr:MAG: SDR family NAD(P)-dependent oxidoreductase [Gammaproteobacteria bacterium]